MQANLKYLRYLIRHKFFVFKAGLTLKVSLWQLIIHDWTKFLPCEWIAYKNYFYGVKNKEAFLHAWNHHQKNNKHHWQYWIVLCDSGETAFLSMPMKYIKEMIADWAGAGRAITGKWEVKDWYFKNVDNIKLSCETRLIVHDLLEKHYG